MLAQNFKTPTDLGLTEDEFRGLRTVLGMLERGELKHVQRNYSDDAPKVSHFNMSDWSCGTAACIGGWAEIAAKLPEYSLCTKGIASESLGQLFYPDCNGPCIGMEAMDHITTTQAAVALRNFLTYGEPRWDEALAS